MLKPIKNGWEKFYAFTFCSTTWKKMQNGSGAVGVQEQSRRSNLALFWTVIDPASSADLLQWNVTPNSRLRLP